MKKLVYLIILLISFHFVSNAQTDSTKHTKVDSVEIIYGGIPDELDPKPIIVDVKNAVYGEFLGNGFAYSLNYARRIYTDEMLSINTRIGIAAGVVPMFSGFGLPLEANVVFLRKKGHSAEMGPGFTWFYGKSRYRNENRELVNSGFYNVCDVTLRVGYLYVGPKGFLFRAAFIPTFAVVSPTIVRENNFFPFGKTFTPWAGISVGYAFNR